MIKIDLHIHTVPCVSKQENFSFSLQKLKEYVALRQIDVIAITNHNLFRKDNYETIKQLLDIVVLPGIEVDLENGHMLVITDERNIDNFKSICDTISFETSNGNSISVQRFKELFKNPTGYLFIPHYRKKPMINASVISQLGKDIFAGEVDNQNKFVRLHKESNDLTPVLFSDCRFEEDSELPLRFTYLDTNSKTLLSIKETLKDKEKVFIDPNKSKGLFPILEDGTEASVGLNIILGKRSSGKTYTLDKIFGAYNNPKIGKSVKYIRQFDLIEQTNEDKAILDFEKRLAEKSSTFGQDYLQEFKSIVDHVATIDFENDKLEVEAYVDSLMEFSSNAEKLDSFSKVPLFSQQPFALIDLNELDELIDAVQKLLDTKNYESVVQKHLDKNSLINLLNALIDEYNKVTLKNKGIEEVNSMISSVKNLLSVESKQNATKNLDLIKCAKDMCEISFFNVLVDKLKVTKTIKNQNQGKFTISARRIPIKNASHLQRIFSNKASYSELFKLYDSPYVYLAQFKKSRNVPENQLYKAFVDIEYKILNEYNLPVSGGERTEFKFEDLIADSEEYEMLLIDEPESSFDNIFLKSNINTRLKNISQKIPVFISTHNNVVGASIKADYIIFTEKVIENSTPIFNVYGGDILSKTLKSINGKETKNYIVQLDCLEGGKETYQERGDSYASIKD